LRIGKHLGGSIALEREDLRSDRWNSAATIGVLHAMRSVDHPRAAVLAVALVVATSCCEVARSTPAPSHNPYVASLRFAECMRAHGVPHPNPDANGDFHLTPAQERRMRGVPQSVRTAAEKACFHHLQGLDNRPLTRQARQRAIGVLKQLAVCIHGFGFEMGRPVVQNKTHGRAFFGFERAPSVKPSQRKALQRAEHTCEKRVDLAGKLDAIIAEDRSGL
jgi:hypothetical protein